MNEKVNNKSRRIKKYGCWYIISRIEGSERNLKIKTGSYPLTAYTFDGLYKLTSAALRTDFFLFILRCSFRKALLVLVRSAYIGSN